MLIAIYNCFVIPYEASFSPSETIHYKRFEIFLDILFGIDVIICFRTTFINKRTGLEVFSQWRIAWNYVRSGRFFIDILAVIPVEVIYGWFAGDSD